MVFLKKNVFRMSLMFLIYIFPSPALSNLRGTDIQNFYPTSSGLDFVTVHSARTLKSYELNFGGFFNYVTNSLSYSKLSPEPSSQNSILYSNVHFGVGLLPTWDVGLSIGSTNSQQIDGQPNFLFFYDVKGLNDIELNSKFRFFEKENIRLAVVGGFDFQRVKINPFSGKEPGPTFNIEAVGDFKINPDVLFAVNFGYRLRNEGSIISNSGVVPISDQLIYSSAISYKTDNEGSAVIGEIYGGSPIEETTVSTDREISNLELLIGYRFSGFKKFHFHGGFGTGVYEGLGSPDFRIYFGLNWRTDQISKAVGFQKEKKPLQPISPKKEEKADDDTSRSIKKEVDEELPGEMNESLEEPVEKKSPKGDQQDGIEDFSKDLDDDTTNTPPVDPGDLEESSGGLYEDY